MAKIKREPTVQEIRNLAAAAQIDERTAKKALTKGVESIRTRSIKDKIRAVLKGLP
jgi:hypothetical protein